MCALTSWLMMDPVGALRAIVGEAAVLAGDAIEERYWHDECLTIAPSPPACVVLPESIGELAQVVRWARSARVALVARGAGTGLSGGAVCNPDQVCVSTERLAGVVDVDELSQLALVSAGTSLQMLRAAVEPLGLRYTVSPGEDAASIGGTIATNAGGMRAVRYGTTRQNVLGARLVVGTGEVLELGGPLRKRSSGYDLLQLVIGSEGTLGIVERAWVRLEPTAGAEALVVAHATSVSNALALLGPLHRLEPPASLIEYVDASTLAALAAARSLELGVPKDALAGGAFVLVGLERIEPADIAPAVERTGALLADAGAQGVWVLEGAMAASLLRAREAAFWTVRALGARDVLDVVVPLSQVAAFLEEVRRLEAVLGVSLPATGHVGDGNVHVSVLAPDAQTAARATRAVVQAGLARGGAVSGEHGLGRAKLDAYTEAASAIELGLARQLKRAFDPDGILAPGRVGTLG